MVYRSSDSVPRNTHLIPAGLALFLTGLIAVLQVRLFGQSWPLLFLPLVIVALWPRQAQPLPSAILLFAGGLWLDWTTLGAPGQWPLIFLIVYLIMRPDLRESRRGIVSGMARYALAVLIAVPVMIVTGYIVYGRLPDFNALIQAITIGVLALPLIALLRDLLANRLGDRERF